MKKHNLELLVGLFVLMGIAAVTYLSLQTGTGSMIGGESYPIEARFANAGGLHTGSSVLLAGVTVGRVEAVAMDPKD